jgi:hypothetical protein
LPVKITYPAPFGTDNCSRYEAELLSDLRR